MPYYVCNKLIKDVHTHIKRSPMALNEPTVTLKLLLDATTESVPSILEISMTCIKKSLSFTFV